MPIIVRQGCSFLSDKKNTSQLLIVAQAAAAIQPALSAKWSHAANTLPIETCVASHTLGYLRRQAKALQAVVLNAGRLVFKQYE